MDNPTLALSPKAEKIGQGFARLYDIIVTLRGPEGCPWDKKQTLSSLHLYLIEEAYELLDGIRQKNLANIQEELGDVYLVNTMIGHVFEVEHEKDLVAVLNEVCEKLIRRHKHVFVEGEQVRTAQEGRTHWLKAKKQEEIKETKNTDLLHSCGRGLPPFEKTIKIQKKIPEYGLEQSYDKNLVFSVLKEFECLNENDIKENFSELTHKFGDMLFEILFLAQKLGINPSEALEYSNNRVIEKISILQEAQKQDS